MSYTWEEVMLGVDVRKEAEKERKQQQDILDEQAAEDTAMGGWSFGLSLLGAALFGPAGYTAGKNIGKWGADYFYDWETMEVDPGKFYTSKAKEFKETRDKAATDQTAGQIVQGITDLAAMYVQAGGLQEGPLDLTTFGSGDAEWSVFGKDPSYVGETSFIPETGEEILKITDYQHEVPSLFSGWQKGEGLISNLQPAVNRIQAAVVSGQSTKSALDKFYDISKEL